MPVARIISYNFEEASQFADYLRPLFDTVEIAQPGRASATPVDLQVDLELCTPEQAWQQVAEMAKQPDTDIFIAPGALVPAAPLEEAGEPAAAQSSGLQQNFAAAPGEVEAGIALAKTRLNWLSRARASMREWRTVRAQLRAIRQVEQHRLQQEQQRQRQMALQFERERREQGAQERALARAAEKQLALQEAERRRLQQQEARRLEAVLQRQAEEEAQRQAQEAVLRRQAEEEALRRQAQEEQLRRQAQEAEAQRAAAVEAALPNSEEQAPQPEAVAATLESEAVPMESRVAELVAASQPEPELAPVRARRDNRLRPAMAMAAFTSVLLMGALLGYAHRRPASPVPLSVLQRSNVVEQKLPFGPAVIPAASLGAPAFTTTAAPATVAAPAPAPEKHDAQGNFRRVRVGNHEVDYVSDDVTVRHFNTPRRGHAVQHPASDSSVSASTQGVKQISDIE